MRSDLPGSWGLCGRKGGRLERQRGQGAGLSHPRPENQGSKINSLPLEAAEEGRQERAEASGSLLATERSAPLCSGEAGVGGGLGQVRVAQSSLEIRVLVVMGDVGSLDINAVLLNPDCAQQCWGRARI